MKILFDGRNINDKQERKIPYRKFFKVGLLLSLVRNTTKICMKKQTNEPQHDKINKVTVRPAKTLISLGIRPV